MINVNVSGDRPGQIVVQADPPSGPNDTPRNSDTHFGFINEHFCTRIKSVSIRINPIAPELTSAVPT
jgi:hypothetical protein